jgi:ABC-2 type transport system permease protein
MNGIFAVLRKELTQMARDPGTIRFAIGIPVFQLILFGLIDTTVKHVPTVVHDQSVTAESRAFVHDLENTGYFRVVNAVPSQAALRDAIRAGRAQVGIEIPPDFARRRLSGAGGDVLVLIDGSDSSISSQTLSAANGLALSHSIDELQRAAGKTELGWRVFPQMLFNPDSRSANLLIPGLLAILLMFSGMVLAAFSIVRERERGTLEQLMVTPVSAVSVVIGKLIPYLLLGMIQFALILALMRWAFQVPIHGNLFLLAGLGAMYLVALLSLGLLVSARAKTQMEAMMQAQGALLPSIFLSGYVFPVTSLPDFLKVLSNLLPATHFIQISRGIIIRGAGITDLMPNVLALLAISTVIVMVSLRAFRKTVA